MSIKLLGGIDESTEIKIADQSCNRLWGGRVFAFLLFVNWKQMHRTQHLIIGYVTYDTWCSHKTPLVGHNSTTNLDNQQGLKWDELSTQNTHSDIDIDMQCLLFNRMRCGGKAYRPTQQQQQQCWKCCQVTNRTKWVQIKKKDTSNSLLGLPPSTMQLFSVL